jgi:hypothetical protein
MSIVAGKDTNTFHVDVFTVVVSLNPEYIYLQITHREAGICYEANVDQTDLRLPCDLQILYKLVCGCFSGEKGHSGDLVICSSSLMVKFRALFGEYFPIDTEVVLREKERSDDDKLASDNIRLRNRVSDLENDKIRLNEKIQDLEEENRRIALRVTELETQNKTLEGVNKMSQEENTRLQYEMEKIVDSEIGISPILGNLKDCEIVMDKAKTSSIYSISLGVSEISLENLRMQVCLEKIRCFFKLKKLSIGGVNGFRYKNFEQASMSSQSVEHLILNHTEFATTSLRGIHNFPKLKRLELRRCEYIVSFVDLLKNYRHTIEEIVVERCPRIDKDELTTYCTQNNIRLSFS